MKKKIKILIILNSVMAIIWLLSALCPPRHLSKAVTMLYMWYTVLNISFHCDFMMNIPQVVKSYFKIDF